MAGRLPTCSRAIMQHAWARVDLLLLEANSDVDDEQRNELIRLAATAGADIEVVEAHAGLTRFGGVGALLRYRPA